MAKSLHIDLDGAWDDTVLDLAARDLRHWGPRLRYCAPAAEIAGFDQELGNNLPPFILNGSGDFHHLAAIFVRRAIERSHDGGGLTLISFDNHPDWDIRPPRWACGGWICRALELPRLEHVSVWGCGNFELRLPSRLFANRAALRDGRLQVHAWAERQTQAVCERFKCMTRSNWRERFEQFVRRLPTSQVYVTVDLDCLSAEEAVTNWENGLFTAADIAWAMGRVRETVQIIGGDLCGAWSHPVYARWRQRFAGNWDHPKLPVEHIQRAKSVNAAALKSIWPMLTGV